MKAQRMISIESKIVLLVSDDLELKTAIERWFLHVKKLKRRIINPLANGSMPYNWESTLIEIDKVINDVQFSTYVILISAYLKMDSQFGFHHAGIDLVHYLRTKLENRVPIIVFCLEDRDKFIKEHLFYHFLNEGRGHYYWQFMLGVPELERLISQAQPFAGMFHELKRTYCTLPGLVSKVIHQFFHDLNRFSPDLVLLKTIEQLKLCLPTEPLVREFETIVRSSEKIDKETARNIINDFQLQLQERLVKDQEYSVETTMNIKVALLEDDEIFRQEVKEKLQKQGITVFIDTVDPEEVVSAFKRDRRGEIEVALLDWRIGDDETIGPNTCQRIKSMRPQVLVYALTVIIGSQAAKITARAGFDDYFDKPPDYTEIVKTIYADVRLIREQLPKLVGLDQGQKDAYFKIITRADRGHEDLEEVIGIAKNTIRAYQKGQINVSLGERFGVGGKDVNIKNVLVNRLVIMAMYKIFSYDDYMVFTTLKYPPEFIGIARENDIKNGEHLVRRVLEGIKKDKITWEKIEDEGYHPINSVFSIKRVVRTPSGSFFWVKKEPSLQIEFEWTENEDEIRIKDALKFSKAFKQFLRRCGLHRRSLLHPDSLLPHESELFAKALKHAP